MMAHQAVECYCRQPRHEDIGMHRFLIAAALLATPLLAPQRAAADTIYPWCLYDTRGGVNCGFVNEWQCRQSKTANADMCGLNGLYFRHPIYEDERPRYRSKRYRRHH
jgi:hypothetical protein